MRVLCVVLPHFPLRCELQRNADIKSPAIVTSAAGSQKLVLDYSPELAGLQRDMPLQEALSRYGEAAIIQADMPYYQSVFNELLDSLEQVSPLVEGSALGCAYLGVDGLHLLYPNNKALVNAVREVIPEAYQARIGIAGGKFLAYLAAGHSPVAGYRILTDDIDDFLRDISCDMLPISIINKNKLHNFRLCTMGQITALPVGPLQAQFGPEGKRLWELAKGYDDTPLHPRLAKEIIEENTTLLSVTASVEAILITLESLLARAFARIKQRGMGICGLTVWTRSWNAVQWERSIRFKEPAMDTGGMLPRLKQVLESFPQPGPVEQVGIKIMRLGYRSGKQRSLFPEIRAQDHLLDDIKELELRLGSPQVYKVKEVEPWSRIPERRFTLAPLSR